MLKEGNQTLQPFSYKNVDCQYKFVLMVVNVSLFICHTNNDYFFMPHSLRLLSHWLICHELGNKDTVNLKQSEENSSLLQINFLSQFYSC